MSLKTRIEKLEQENGTGVDVATLIRAARAQLDSDEPQELPTLAELENIIATSKSEFSVRLARAKIRLRDYRA